MATSEPEQREAPPTPPLSLQTHSTFLLIGMTFGGFYGAHVAASVFARVNVVFTGIPSITPTETSIVLCFITAVYAIVYGGLALVVPMALFAVRGLFDRWLSESRLNVIAALAVGFAGWLSFLALFYVAPLFESQGVHAINLHVGLLSPAVNAGVAVIFLGIAFIVFCTLRSENIFSRSDNKLPFILASATVSVCTGQSIYYVNSLLPDLISKASLLGNTLFLGVQLTLGVVLLVAFKRELRRKNRWGQFSTWLAFLLLVVSVLVFLGSTTQPIAKDYAFKTGPQLVRTMLWTLVDVFDRDGDGYSAFSIVKDSVEGDSSINVFAIDIPNNGVDEDGVGGDLTTAALKEVKGVLGTGTGKFQDEMIRQLLAERKLNVILIKLDGFRADRLPGRGYFRPVADGLKGLIDDSVDCIRARTPSTGTSAAVTSALKSMSPVSHRLSAAESPQQTKSIFGAKEALFGGVDQSSSKDLFELMWGAGFYTVAILDQGPQSSFYAIDETIVPSMMPLGIDVKRKNRHYFRADEMRTVFEEKFEKLKKRKRNLFFYIGFHEPHAPLDKTRGRQLLGKPGGRETGLSPSKLDGEFMAASYDANVEHVTEELTKLISYLRQNGEYSNSLIVVFSDHGEEFLEHGGVYHRSTLYRELTDVVLLFKFPGEFGAGTKLERLTSLLDIAPTILDAVDVERPVNFEGASILPLIRSHFSPHWRSYVRMDLLFRRDNIRFAVESDRYKYIYNFFNGTEELYDLREDRFEANNIVSEEGRTAREMKLLLFNWKSYDELRSRGMWPNE